MDRKIKKRNKKIVKIMIILTWLSFSVIVISIIFAFIYNPIMLLLIFFSLFIMMISSIICSKYVIKLNDYKKKIQYLRQCRYFTNCLQAIRSTNFKETRYWYNKLLKDQKLKDFLFPFYISALQHSNVEIDNNEGNILYNNVLEIYNPEEKE